MTIAVIIGLPVAAMAGVVAVVGTVAIATGYYRRIM